MRKVLIIVVAMLIGLVLLLQVTTTPWIVRRLTFVPRPLPDHLRDPARWRLSGEQVWIPTVDGRQLHGWWIPARVAAEQARCGAVVNLNGNAGNITNRAWLGDRLSRRGHDVLLFDYGGYGASDGAPSETGLYRDADAAYGFVREHKAVPAGNIVLVAHSLGTAVATELARDRTVGAIVLVAPFTSLPEAARAKLRVVPRWLFDWQEGRFEALESMSGINAPILMALGTEDALVAYGNARALFAAANEPKTWRDVPGADHNGVFSNEAFMHELNRFIHDSLGCREKTSAIDGDHRPEETGARSVPGATRDES